MRHTSDRAVGVLLLVIALLGIGACGDDDDGGDDARDGRDICRRADELLVARDAVPTAQPTTPEAFDVAKTKVLELVDALVAVLDAVPPELEGDAAEVRESVDDIANRIRAAEGEELFVEVPALLAQIPVGASGPFARITEYVDRTC